MSVQLYSVREALAADLDGTLARLAGLGLRNVEAFDFVRRAPELAAALRAVGLAAPTGHATLLSRELRFGDTVVPVPPLDETFAAAKELGLDVVIDAFVPPARWADETEIARTAELLNEAADAASAYGLRVGYHNHAHEFAHQFGGTSAFELFAGRLADGVTLEVDVYWAHVAGQDVPALLRRLGERVVAIHVKDGFGGGDPFSAEGAQFDQRAAGQGGVPLAGILDAASSVSYDVIEFDQYAGDIFDGIAQSVAFLNERGIR